jgi:hypothetical protein
MTDETAELAPASDYRVCAPLVRAKTMTQQGVRWLDFMDGAPLPDDVDADWLAHLLRKKLIRHKDEPTPTGINAWPGSMGAEMNPEKVQKQVIEAMDAAGAARSRGRGRRERPAQTPLSAAVGGDQGDGGDPPAE